MKRGVKASSALTGQIDSRVQCWKQRLEVRLWVAVFFREQTVEMGPAQEVAFSQLGHTQASRPAFEDFLVLGWRNWHNDFTQ